MTSPPPPRVDLEQWLEALANDSEVLPHHLDAVNRRLLLVRLPAAQVREAPFLDGRAFKGRENAVWIPLEAALSHLPPPNKPAGVIMHCGHTGSTLISRLLGELPGAWVLREPLVFQALAAEARIAGTPHARLTPQEFSRTLELVERACAKTPAEFHAAIIKLTSHTANLGALIPGQNKTPAICCLWISLREYLATMLRDPALREALRLAAGQWVYDVSRVIGPRCPALAEMGDAKLAALGWVAAQLAFSQAVEEGRAPVLGLCFDDFLLDPADGLERLARHFGLSITRSDADRALSGPWLHRYAKDPRYPFDASVRRRELEDATKRYDKEIGVALSFAERLWKQLPMAHALSQPL